MCELCAWLSWRGCRTALCAGFVLANAWDAFLSVERLCSCAGKKSFHPLGSRLSSGWNDRDTIGDLLSLLC